ncbi:MAG: hypothetical protein HZA46_11825 [Planctomycetales bacterium]|nr:hypothetical protein [Planctomycetales bacterium]
MNEDDSQRDCPHHKLEPVQRDAFIVAEQIIEKHKPRLSDRSGMGRCGREFPGQLIQPRLVWHRQGGSGCSQRIEFGLLRHTLRALATIHNFGGQSGPGTDPYQDQHPCGERVVIPSDHSDREVGRKKSGRTKMKMVHPTN